MRESTERKRLVVSVIDPEPVGWDLPAAMPHGDSFIAGGVRTLHELAVAASAVGRDVELRGPVSLPVLDELAEAAGARPSLPDEPRRPVEQDIVVVLGGGYDLLRFARYVLSPARFVIALLAPPGLTGWPFERGWEPPSGLIVPVDSVARPEHFRAMAALGVDLWTHMRPVQERALAVGASCEFIGNGDPLAPAEPAPVKDLPVAYLQANGWRLFAERVAREMRTPVHAIPEGDHETVMDAVARAHVLLWPARVTGHGRVLWEARARGTVVVGLSSNIYATGLEESCGAIPVDSLDQMPEVVESLLADPARLRALSQAGVRSARAQVDWPLYLQRVDAAITATEQRDPDDSLSARAAIGDRLSVLLTERERAIERVSELDDALADSREVLESLGTQLRDAHEQAAAQASVKPPVKLARVHWRRLVAELGDRARRRLPALR